MPSARSSDFIEHLWGSKQPYVACEEDKASFFAHCFYTWSYPFLSQAAREQLTAVDLPPPTEECVAHNAGTVLASAVAAALDKRHSWDEWVGAEVVLRGDTASRGWLRYVGIPQQGGYDTVMAGVEWTAVPASRVTQSQADPEHSPLFSGVAHGEHLFAQQLSDRGETCTLELVKDVELVSPPPSLETENGVITIPPPPPQDLRLARLLFQTFPYYIYWQIPLVLTFTACQLAAPLLLQAMIAYLSTADPTWTHGLAIAGSIFVVQLLQSVTTQRYNFVGTKGGAQFRSALNGLLFQKVFTISRKALTHPEFNAGRIITMMSTDVEKAWMFVIFCMQMWSSPVTLIVAIALLARLVGWCAVVAVAAVVAVLPVNGILMKRQAASRKELMRATDARIKATNEFFTSIRVAKLMAWEPRFVAAIEAKRAVELYHLKQIQRYRVLMSFLSAATPMLTIAMVFVVFSVSGHELKPTIVFPTIALLSIIRAPFQQIPMLVTTYIQFFVSMQRLTRFFETDDAAFEKIEAIDAFAEHDGVAHTAHGPLREGGADNSCPVAAALRDASLTTYVPLKLPLAPVLKRHWAAQWLQWLCCCERCRPQPTHPCPTATAAPPEAPASSLGGDLAASPGGGGKKGKKGGPPPLDGFYELDAKTLLHDVTLRIPKGKLTVIIGSTGCGKSTLLQAFLSEVDVTKGRIWTDKSLAYVPQQAWVMNATVRENIVFYGDDNNEALESAVQVCQLDADLEQLYGGLETEIGEKGVTLSGGQKARVSLARAVYADRDVYLLDDPLSALDAHVGRRILNDCIVHRLAGKTRILATHQLDAVPLADYVVTLSNGTVTFTGTASAFMESETYSALKSVTASPDTAPDGSGKATGSPMTASPTAAPGGGDGKKNSSSERKTDGKEGPKTVSAAAATATPLMSKEEKASGSVPLATYLLYFRHCGGRLRVGVTFAIFIVTEILIVSSSLWLSAWSTTAFDLQPNTYLIVYVVLVLLGAAGTPTRYFSAYDAMRHASISLHRSMLRCVARGTLEFFDTTPLGRVLNRFSKDVDLIDNALQLSAIMFLECFCAITSSALVAIVSQPLVLVAFVPCVFFYRRIMVFFNAANREVRRNSSIQKSPLFSLLGEAVGGATTIRAFDRASAVMKAALDRIDIVFGCTTTETCAKRWLGVRIELISNVIVTSVAVVGVMGTMFSSTTRNTGLVSLSLTMAMQTTAQLNWLLRQTAAIEADMNSVERIQHYSTSIATESMPELDAEVEDLERRSGFNADDVSASVVIEPVAGHGGVSRSATGPSRDAVSPGSLSFRHVNARYREGLPLVLKNVSFEIHAGEKVGVVGRTGSGKSTLFLTLLRLVETCGGTLDVCGRPIQEYGLRPLRQLFSMVPQDPVLFDGTVRLNIDPMGESTEEMAWKALDMVGLRDRVSSEAEGLESRVLEGGTNFSVGQRQLLCMARALLRRSSRFLLMDEATANVDPHLDRLLQQAVRTAFADYTVLTIAHRLQTVATYDRILVMEDGTLKESGNPWELVSNPTSLFHELVSALGEDGKEQFMNAARTKAPAE